MARIVTLAHFVPDNVIRNEEFVSLMDTSDEWIQQRTGIKERRWARSLDTQRTGISNAMMVAHATQKALNRAGLEANQLDAVVYATISPDKDFPGSGGALLKLLDIKKSTPVFEVRNQCSGFLYGLQVARAAIDAGSWRYVLVIGAEILSSGLNLSNDGRNTAVLFGDGCGVALMGPSIKTDGGTAEILALKIEADGSYAEKLGVKRPGFETTPIVGLADFEGEDAAAFPRMDGKFVFKMASMKMPEIVRKVLEQAKTKVEELDLIVPHQANQRILDMLGHELQCPNKIYSNISRYGNTTAGSIPIAFSEALEEGRVKPGNLICLTAFGSGFSWGACLLRWG